VLTTARVKSAMVHHDICHRDEEFPKVVRRLRRKLRRVFGGGPQHDVLLITGSGTSGMEAAISSCVPENKKLLVVANGAFGERFIEIAEQHRLNLVPLHYKWGQLVQPADIAAMLRQDPDIFAVAMCHHETSVGLINPIHEVGSVVRAHDRLFVVDAVASLGAEPLNVQEDNIDVCVSSANKCLHSTSGVATVCVSERAWQRIEQVHPRVYYLNLKRYRKYAVEKEETPFTPTVSGFFALDAAVSELLAEGVEHRIATYRRRNERIRRRLAHMGLEFLSETGTESKTVTCVKVPRYITFKEIYTEMKRRGYLIYNSKEHLKDRYFQVANMGNLSDETIEEFLSSLQMVLMQFKARVRSSTAVRRSAVASQMIGA
jgi:2-aminoethylphosphonate-pyruvate transaminase